MRNHFKTIATVLGIMCLAPAVGGPVFAQTHPDIFTQVDTLFKSCSQQKPDQANRNYEAEGKKCSEAFFKIFDILDQLEPGQVTDKELAVMQYRTGQVAYRTALLRRLAVNGNDAFACNMLESSDEYFKLAAPPSGSRAAEQINGTAEHRNSLLEFCRKDYGVPAWRTTR